MSKQETNADKNAHSSKKQARGSTHVHSKLDDSTHDGYQPTPSQEEEE